MTSQTKYSQSTPAAALRSMEKYSGTIFVLLLISTNLLNTYINLMTEKFVPTLQSGSMRRPPKITWILMIVSHHAEHPSTDAKPAPTKIIHSSVSEMEPKFVSTKIWFAMVTPCVTSRKMKISHSAEKNISSRN